MKAQHKRSNRTDSVETHQHKCPRAFVRERTILRHTYTPELHSIEDLPYSTMLGIQTMTMYFVICTNLLVH